VSVTNWAWAFLPVRILVPDFLMEALGKEWSNLNQCAVLAVKLIWLPVEDMAD
jgi:hypothetical protein